MRFFSQFRSKDFSDRAVGANQLQPAVLFVGVLLDCIGSQLVQGEFGNFEFLWVDFTLPQGWQLLLFGHRPHFRLIHIERLGREP